MRSPKSRSRSKSNRRSQLGNIVNRVFESAGPEGKVRGTPQQIIDKYLQAAHDAQRANDPVAAENFLQHAEHYIRLLNEAQREIEARREQQQQQQQRQRPPREDEPQPSEAEPEPAAESTPGAAEVIDTGAAEESTLVEEPAAKPARRRSTRSSRGRGRAAKADPADGEGDSTPARAEEDAAPATEAPSPSAEPSAEKPEDGGQAAAAE